MTAEAPAVGPSRRAGRARRTAALVAGTLLLVLVATALGVWFSPIGARYREAAADAAPVTGVDTVPIADSRFGAASIAVPVGTTVTWVWTDGEQHDVVFEDGPAAPIRSDGTWTRTFDAAGQYDYRCTLHAFMDGRVVVGG